MASRRKLAWKPRVVPSSGSGVTTNALALMGAARAPHSAYVPPQGPDGDVSQIYKISTGSWAQTIVDQQAAGSMLGTACYVPANVSTYGNRIYIFGNIDVIPPAAMYYDPVTDTKPAIADLPNSIGGCVTYCGYGSGKIWIFGGMSTVGPYNPSSAIQSYDLATNTYSTAGFSLPTAAGQLVGATDPNTGYLYFGLGTTDPQLDPPSSITTLQTWYRFNPASPAAPTAMTSIIDRGVAQSGCAYFNGNIYIIGGSVNAQALTGTRRVYRYNIAGNSWTRMNDFPVDTAAGPACEWNGSLYCAPGWNATGFDANTENTSDKVYVYNESGDSWSIHSTRHDQSVGSILCGVNV